MSKVANHRERVKQARQETFEKLTSDPYIGYDSIQEALDDARCTTQAEVMSRLLNRENLFISGPAGSGKTTIIQRFIDFLDAQFEGTFEVAVTASTGIAATLINGRTIHSWSGLGIDDSDFDAKKMTPQMWNAWDRIKYVDVLIIDEVSMLPGYLFTKIDKFMQHVRKNNAPFGGVQIVLLGDFMQLPPVSRKEAVDRGVDTGFAYNTESWEEAGITHCYMDKVHRATDAKLKEALTRIANNRVNDDVRDVIESRKHTFDEIEKLEKPGGKVYTRLFTTNRNVDKYNQDELDKNPNRLMMFPAEAQGPSKEVSQLMKNRNVPELIHLKQGAKIIITSNISDMLGNQVAANGSLGEVTDFQRGTRNPVIRFNDGTTHVLEAMTYSQEKEIKNSYQAVDPKDEQKTVTKHFTTKETVATVQQYPVKLGYAITVHKSQGQTFDGVVVDLSKTFQPGLGYVALSRVRSLDDLVISGFHSKAYNVSQESLGISRQVKRSALNSREEFAENAEYYETLLKGDQFAIFELWNPNTSGVARRPQSS